MATPADAEIYRKVRTDFTDQANAMIKSGTPFHIILTALSDITLQMAIKSEPGGNSAAALKRLQDHLAIRFPDMAANGLRS